ncbi:MAG TPA: hypothetical protein PLS90_13160, partial [Candidatus Sumerlaeota bacterium]|nr:hypothetical protein [Candidatus Sumerlaeota bacterium]
VLGGTAELRGAAEPGRAAEPGGAAEKIKPKMPRRGWALTKEQINFIRHARDTRTTAQTIEDFYKVFGFKPSERTIRKFRNSDPAKLRLCRPTPFL